MTLRRLMPVVLGVLVVVATTTTAVASAHRRTGALVVRTTSGSVMGQTRYGVENFLGIPYAAPPVGKDRWRPPQPVKPWHGTRDASHYGSKCAQTPGLDAKNGSTSENCLFVNVQRPIGAGHRGKLRPVYVYIHGGGFNTGSGENTEKLVRDTGIVGVSMNYRLGTLGFLSLPVLTARQGESGNYGIMDQQLALRWIHSNIARFGGDPDRITLAGESAGGIAVCYAMTSPKTKGLFAQAMIQSGGCSTRTQDAAETNGEMVAAKLGCPDGSGQVACLRTKSVSQLLAAGGVLARAVTGTPTLPTDPAKDIRNGRFTHVPTVIGTQRDEGRSLLQDAIGWTKAQYVAWLRTAFGADAAKVYRHYPWPASANRLTPAYLVSAVATDAGLIGTSLGPDGRIVSQQIGGCGALGLVREMARYTRTYFYQFDHRTGPGWVDVPGFVWGAGHATELGYLFPLHDIDTESEYREFGPAEFALADQMVQYWGAFVRSGRPSPARLHQPAWPTYTGGSNARLLSLRTGADGQTTTISVRKYSAEHMCAFWRDITVRTG